MSNVYINQPPTNGKVIVTTTFGDIEIELWAKEAPKACRNFIQLCLEGYYEGCIFHRVVPNFIAQTGDRTGTGEGGESIYGKPFEDEFHNRIKFSHHRGMVATAGQRDSNDSQFFITLDKSDYLNGKHTIFGKVVGNTIFNVLKMGDLETNEHDMPLYPPKILKTEVLNNPFPDIVPRVKKVEKKVVEKKKKNAVKDYGLLSFGDEAEMDEQVVKPSTKGKSSHDLLNDPKLSKKKAVEVKPVAQEEIIPVGDTNATAFQNKMREKAKARIAALTSKPTEPTKTEEETEEPTKEEEQAPQKEKPKKLSFKASNADDKAGKDYLAQQRQKFLEKKRKTGTDREEEALKRVQMFSNRLLNGPPEKKRKVDEEEEGWQNHELKFDKTHTRETKKAEEDFEVYDPLTHTVEKGKSR